MPSAVPTTPAKITAVKPTTTETLAPKISRESTSRPSWSVPSRYWVLPPVCQNGGRKRAARLPTSGLWGASTSAKIATSPMTTRIRVGITGKSSSRKETDRQRIRGGATIASARVLMPLSPFQPDAGVDHGVQNVDHHIHNHDHSAAQHHDALDHREVAKSNSLIEEPPDTWPGEHGLHHHRHIDHDHEIDPGQCQHRDQGILESVLGDDQGLGEPLDPCELDIFRAQHLEHRRAGQ